VAGVETKGEILSYLDKVTREIDPPKTESFTTTAVAGACHVSRNLASQYLNELVREGLAIKAGSRPVLFLHRRDLERYLQTKLAKNEYSSMSELLMSAGRRASRDFEQAIGSDLSLGQCVEQLKSAMQYPPHGIPVLLVGDHGTGKEYLSRLTFEYGKNAGILNKNASYISVDASRHSNAGVSLERLIFGDSKVPGSVGNSHGGVVYIRRFDHLDPVSRDAILQRIRECETGAREQGCTARFILGTSRDIESDAVKAIARSIPIVIRLPRLSERTMEERTLLVMDFLNREGQRAASDVAISRGALRALVASEFEDNVDGLRACITNCCANSYLNRKDDSLVIQTYNLPPDIISSLQTRVDDDQLIPGGAEDAFDTHRRVTGLFQQIVDSFCSFEEEKLSFDEFFSSAVATLKAYEDYLDFDDQNADERSASYEQVIGPIVDEVNESYGLDLTRKTARLLSHLVASQLWAGTPLTSWRLHNRVIFKSLCAELSRRYLVASSAVSQIDSKVRLALGAEIDDFVRAVLLLEICHVLSSGSKRREALGVVMCHGYSTATSIAEAANRMLHLRVFEAIDMTYEQQFSDVAIPLAHLLERFSFCESMVILVDMGSLEQVLDVIPRSISSDVYVITNVSTGLALEVGSILASKECLSDKLPKVLEAGFPSYRVARLSKTGEKILFCSEAGVGAAEKIRRLIQDSLPESLPVSFATCDYNELVRDGNQSLAIEGQNVRAIVGTMNPNVTSVPFVALEDLLSQGYSDKLDAALAKYLDRLDISAFHSALLKNLTLRNVVESITILNPEMLYVEADNAIQRLAQLSGKKIDSRRRLGLYVHLCGLIERLVTNNFVDSFLGEDEFARSNPEFIAWFRTAFSEMCQRYRVEIPVSEIAYVHKMLETDDTGGEVGRSNQASFEDE
jgi:transcriptional regulatory protein LevR/transcriptional regulator with AAA-type ATPase domain